MDKGENIIGFLMLIPSIIKRICFVEGKKLKLSIDKSYKSEKRFLEEVKVIFIKIIKTCVLVLIKNLIVFKAISLK